MIIETRQLFRNHVHIIFMWLSILLFNSHVFGQSDRYQLSKEAEQELAAVQDLLQRNEYQPALDILNKLVNTVRNRRYDLAVTYQTQGYIYSMLNRTRDATLSFINAIDTRGLPPAANNELHYTVAQYLISDGKYSEGMDYLTTWFRNEKKPSAEAHYMAATAYYFLNDYKQLIYQARNALSKRSDAPASWYEILLAGYFETGDMNAAAELMETMLNRFPGQTQYWMQLAGVYLSIKKNERALALMEVAYIKGIIKDESGLLQLAQTYLYMEMPYKAATLLSTEMEDGKIDRKKQTLIMLADSWFLAREVDKGIEVLSDAVTTINDPELYFRLGQLYVEKEDWGEAIKTLNQVTKVKDYKDIADAYLLLGIAALQGKEMVISYQALNNALKYDATREQAQQWMAELRN